MAITLTVGTNTYTSLEDADAYFVTIGNLDWAGFADEDRKQALVLGTQSIDLLYGQKFLSYLGSETQALLFPREAFYDQDGRNITGIPTSLKNATAEVGMLYLNGTDIFPLASTAQNVRDESLTVGGVSISTSNFRAAENESFEGFRKIDILLRPILRSVKGNWRLSA